MSKGRKSLREAEDVLRSGEMKLAQLQIPGSFDWGPFEGSPNPSPCANMAVAEFERLFRASPESRKLALRALALRKKDGSIECPYNFYRAPEVAAKIVVRAEAFELDYEELEEITDFLDRSVNCEDGSIKTEPTATGKPNRNAPAALVLHSLVIRREAARLARPHADMTDGDQRIEKVSEYLLRHRDSQVPAAWRESQDTAVPPSPAVTAICVEALLRAGTIPKDEARAALEFILDQQRKDGRKGSWISLCENVGTTGTALPYNQHYYIARAICAGVEHGVIGARRARRALKRLLRYLVHVYRPEGTVAAPSSRSAPLTTDFVTWLAQELSTIRIITVALRRGPDRYRAWRYTTWSERERSPASANGSYPRMMRKAKRLQMALNKQSALLTLIGIIVGAISVVLTVVAIFLAL